MMRNICIAAASIVFFTADFAWAQQAPVAKNFTASDIVQSLGELIDAREFREPMPLKQALDRIDEILAGRGKRLPFRIDESAFQEEAAEADPMADEKVSWICPFFQPSVGQMLVQMLDQTRRFATIIVRPGWLEVTTRERALPVFRLSASVLLQVRNRPAGLILDDLFLQTGVGVTVDPGVASRLRTPVSVNFVDPIRLEDALSVVLNASNLRYVTIGRAIYVTTPERAQQIWYDQILIRDSWSGHSSPLLGGTPPFVAPHHAMR